MFDFCLYQCAGESNHFFADGVGDQEIRNGADLLRHHSLEGTDAVAFLIGTTARMANDPPESDDETPRHWADRGTRDGLTGVWTRAAFDERLAAGLAAATNHRESLALLLIDVDRLGAFNAQYGRPAGDVALKTIAKRIASALTSPDVLARFADDEFAVLCRRPMNTYGVALAQALRGKIAGGAIDIPGSGDAFFFTVSIGVSLFPAAGIADASALVAAAGGALRQAKQNGRDRVCVANNPAEGE